MEKWKQMEIYGNIWKLIEIDENMWIQMGIDKNRQKQMKIYKKIGNGQKWMVYWNRWKQIKQIEMDRNT